MRTQRHIYPYHPRFLHELTYPNNHYYNKTSICRNGGDGSAYKTSLRVLLPGMDEFLSILFIDSYQQIFDVKIFDELEAMAILKILAKIALIEIIVGWLVLAQSCFFSLKIFYNCSIYTEVVFLLALCDSYQACIYDCAIVAIVNLMEHQPTIFELWIVVELKPSLVDCGMWFAEFTINWGVGLIPANFDLFSCESN